jgi:16S rRNA processing protein RimM
LTEKFAAGLVGGPFGLEGFVKVKPLSGEIEHLLKLRQVTIRQDGKEKQMAIEESAAAASALIMRFSGYDSPEAAKTLTGAELLVAREQACPLADGEFYVEDLKGLAVVAAGGEKPPLGEDVPAGEALAVITAIVEGGGGDLAEIRLTDGRIKLIPFRKEFFVDINPEKGRVTLKNLWVLE